MNRVVVTETEYNKAASVFREAAGFECIPAPADESVLAAKIRETGARFVVIGTTPYNGELYDALPRGGVIARFGVGHDGVNKLLAKNKGLFCCNTPGALDDSVAECAMGLILSCARHLAECSALNRTGVWQPSSGIELQGKILAVIGYGNIGSRLARIAKAGFGMKVVGFSTHEPRKSGFLDVFSGEFGEAVKDADFVSVHLPSTPGTLNFINAEKLKMLKPSATLINTSRGAVLDEDALYDAVESGTIAAAGLDVFKIEPYVPQSLEKDLRHLDRVLMTPHIGSNTREACERMARAALRNIQLAVQGQADHMDLVD